jgi:hypothetical protein
LSDERYWGNLNLLPKGTTFPQDTVIVEPNPNQILGFGTNSVPLGGQLYNQSDLQEGPNSEPEYLPPDTPAISEEDFGFEWEDEFHLPPPANSVPVIMEDDNPPQDAPAARGFAGLRIKMPRYSGRKQDNVRQFFSKLEKFIEQQGVAAEDNVGALGLALENDALACYDNFLQENEDITYDELKEQIILRFDDDRTNLVIRSRINNRKLRKEESISDFFNALRRDADKIQLEDPALLVAFLAGLPTHIAEMVTCSQPATASEAFQRAKTLEQVRSLNKSPEEKTSVDALKRELDKAKTNAASTTSSAVQNLRKELRDDLMSELQKALASANIHDSDTQLNVCTRDIFNPRHQNFRRHANLNRSFFPSNAAHRDQEDFSHRHHFPAPSSNFSSHNGRGRFENHRQPYTNRGVHLSDDVEHEPQHPYNANNHFDRPSNNNRNRQFQNLQ